MKRFVFFSVLAGILGAGMFFVLYKTERTSDLKQDGKLSVVTTLFPLYDFVKKVGGDRVAVSLLLPPGVEAHAFEPTPGDIARIHRADVFVYTGEFMEPWAHDIIDGAEKDIKVVDASVGIEPTKEEEADHYDESKDEYHNGGVDPHIWLDFENATLMVGTIAEVFAEVDPEYANRYRENATLYRERLSALDRSYRASLESCMTKRIVYGGHYAFGYLARRYGLQYSAAQGFSPDAEPSAKDLAMLVERVRSDNIRFIFYEELTSPKIAETIAREAGAELLLLNAAHNISKEDYNTGVTFLLIMEENRKNLVRGLECRNNDQ